MNRRIILTTIFSAVVLSIIAVSCGPIKRGEYVEGSVDVYCDDGFKQILEEEIGVFEYTYDNKPQVVPFYVSETEAINRFIEDKAPIIVTTHEISKDQIELIKQKYKKVVRQKSIAVDAVALIVNKDNPLSQLSMEEIGDIINGRTTKWYEIAGTDSARIKLVFDNPGSSTVSFLREKFIKDGSKISDHAYAEAVSNNEQVFDIVKKDPRVIGVISVSWLGSDLEKAQALSMEDRLKGYKNENDTINSDLTDQVKVLKVSNPTIDNDYTLEAYKPYQAYIATGQYPLFRKVWMASVCPSGSVGHSFFVFVTGFVGQKIIMTTGILPMEMHKRVVHLN